jgi:uncharacterized protein YjbI with pentapeptide repeats
MEENYTADKLFDKIDFTAAPLNNGTYENCSFTGCDFSGSCLTECQFIDCQFKNCNLTLADLSMTTLNNVDFINCKMIGLRFDTCNQFALSINFDSCSLNDSSFYRIKLKKPVFRNCKLNNTDLTECDLSGSVFDKCDFSGAMFDRTIIENSDLRTSYNYIIDPENNRIKKARFSRQNIAGLLSKYEIQIED